MLAMLKSKEAFAVLRADLFLGASAAPEDLVTVTKVVPSQQRAEAEVARLNAMQADTSVRYWWQVTRLAEDAVSDDGSVTELGAAPDGASRHG